MNDLKRRIQDIITVLNRAFHHPPIAEANVQRTTHITVFGLVELAVMTFALRNETQPSQRFTDKVLRGFNFCVRYVDDILMAPKPYEQRLKHSREIFR